MLVSTEAVIVVIIVVVIIVIIVVVEIIVVVLVVVVVAEKKVLSHPTMGGVILRLGALPEPWEYENTSEDLRRS